MCRGRRGHDNTALFEAVSNLYNIESKKTAIEHFSLLRVILELFGSPHCVCKYWIVHNMVIIAKKPRGSKGKQPYLA